MRKKQFKISSILLSFILVSLWGCNNHQSVELIGINDITHFTIDEFNNAFYEEKFASSPENAASLIYIDKNQNILSNEKYHSSEKAYIAENYEAIVVSLDDYNQLMDDKYATVDYLKIVPMGPGQNLFIHDPYAINEKRMTHQEVSEVIAEYYEKINDNSNRKMQQGSINCDNSSNVCTGDVFFQWGSAVNPTSECDGISNGSSPAGHISIVELGYSPCLSTPTLNDVHIFEAWFTGINVDATYWEWLYNTIGSVRHVRSDVTWGWTNNTHCTNFWHNTYLDSRQGKKDEMRAFLADEHGRGYGFAPKPLIPHPYARPLNYYCSLLNWVMYNEILGWKFDQDGGPIVTPVDQGMFMYFRSNLYNSSWYPTHFEHCDFW